MLNRKRVRNLVGNLEFTQAACTNTVYQELFFLFSFFHSSIERNRLYYFWEQFIPSFIAVPIKAVKLFFSIFSSGFSSRKYNETGRDY